MSRYEKKLKDGTLFCWGCDHAIGPYWFDVLGTDKQGNDTQIDTGASMFGMTHETFISKLKEYGAPGSHIKAAKNQQLF